MVLGVQFDVAVEVLAQGWRLASDDLTALQQPFEHARDNAFAAVQEGGGHTMGGRIQRDVQRAGDEVGHAGQHIDLAQGGIGFDAPTLQRDERIDSVGTGAHFEHGFAVQLEVAAMTAPGVFVRLLAQHDFVDQAGGLRVGRREPG